MMKVMTTTMTMIVMGKVVTALVMKIYIRHVNVWLHSFLTSALNGDESSASRPDRFNPGDNGPGMD
jgi:hypothetical protein